MQIAEHILTSICLVTVTLKFYIPQNNQLISKIADFHHTFDGFQVPDCTGKPVQYSLGLCMTVVMSVFSMGMHDSGAIFQNMGMHMLFLAFMQVVL